MSATTQSPGPVGSSPQGNPGPEDKDRPPDRHPPPAESIHEAFARLPELKEFAAYYAAARFDAWKATARGIAIYAGLGLMALVGAAALVATAVVFLLLGVSAAFAQLLPGHPWLGYIITSVIFLGLMAGGSMIAMRVMARVFRNYVVEKYESRQSRQREQFGRDVRHEAKQADRAES